MEGASIDWTFLIGQLFGGLSLFLYGMGQMTKAMRESTGEQMKDVLRSLSASKFIGLLTGIFVTGILQSSAVVAVMVVGFVSSGLMTFKQTLGILLGAGIGTTLTSQMVAFDVTKYSLWMVFLGFLTMTLSKTKRWEWTGAGTMGLGLVFYGLDVMSASMVPLRTYPPFLRLLQSMDNVVVGVAVACLFTALIQSSTATVGIAMALATQHLISLRAGLCLVLGANVGTAITAILASLSLNRDAKRVALANVLFKAGGVIMVLPFFSQMTVMVQGTSEELPRQIANAHTIWNVLVAVCFLPFTDYVARLVLRLLPDNDDHGKRHHDPSP
jgi:phosphate:Na+ symporter